MRPPRAAVRSDLTAAARGRSQEGGLFPPPAVSSAGRPAQPAAGGGGDGKIDFEEESVISIIPGTAPTSDLLRLNGKSESSVAGLGAVTGQVAGGV